MFKLGLYTDQMKRAKSKLLSTQGGTSPEVQLRTPGFLRRRGTVIVLMGTLQSGLHPCLRAEGGSWRKRYSSLLKN